MCNLQKSDTGQLERTVSLVAIELVCEDSEKIFVQVGTWDVAKGVSPKCQLPGSKRRGRELPHKAVERLLSTDLHAIADFIELGHREHSVEHKGSPQYGIPTTYFRALQYGTLLNNSDEDLAKPQLILSKLDTDTKAKLRGLLDADVYMISSGPRKMLLYTCMDKLTFACMQTPAYKDVLHSWLSALQINSDICSFESI